MRYLINIVPVTVDNKKLLIYPASDESKSSFTAYENDFTDSTLVKFRESKNKLSLNGKPEEAIKLDIFNNINISKRVLLTELRDFLLQKQKLVISKGFIDEINVYIKEDSFSNQDFERIKKIKLRIVYKSNPDRFGILVSYGGRHLIYKKKLSQLNTLAIKDLTKIICNNQIYHIDDLPPELSKDYEDFKIVYNRHLGIKTNINGDVFLYHKEKNKYKSYYLEVNNFQNKYLADQQIGESFKILNYGFQKIDGSSIHKTSSKSNLLAFAQDQTDFNVYNGLKNYGPLSLPKDISQIKFLFIFPNDDKDIVNKFYTYLNKGLKGFPGLEKFVGIPISKENILTEYSIRYTGINPEKEIIDFFSKTTLDINVKYFAFYLSKVSKNETDGDKAQIYYKVKEALLGYGITSQTIFIENIYEPSFSFYLPNIAIGLLAKCGGKPWKLARPISEDLIVGIGAFRKGDQIYFGNSLCFKNDGTFEEFDSFCEQKILPLGARIQNNIKNYIGKNKKAERLIIHFYKEMSKKEEKYLLRVLSNLKLNIPYVVLSVTDSNQNDFVVFDIDYTEKMPVSGSFIKLSNKEFLLCNNTRYETKTATRIDDYPLPIKIKISKAYQFDYQDDKSINDLVDQVYQFSRIYWRSIRQKEKPVTIGYSEIVARFSSHFTNSELPANDVARKTLWFI